MSMQASRPLGTDFYRLLVGQSISVFGSSVTRFALPLLVYDLTHSALQLAIVMAIAYVPQAILALPFGALVDRFAKRGLLVFANVTAAIAVGSVPLLAHFGLFTLPSLYVGTFFVSALSLIAMSAEFSSTPLLVEPTELVRANNRVQTAYLVTLALGPAIAGMVVHRIGIFSLLAFDAGTHLVAALIFGSISTRLANTGPEKAGDLVAEMREGLAFVRTRPVLLTLALFFLASNFVQSTVRDQLVLLAKEGQHATDRATGLLFSFESLGFVVGALIAERFGKVRLGRLVIGAAVVQSATFVAMGTASSAWVAMPIWSATAASGLVINVNSASLRQSLVPTRLLGRVSGITTMLANITVPIGSVLGGLIVERGLRIGHAYVGAGLLSLVIALAFAATPLARAELGDEARS